MIQTDLGAPPWADLEPPVVDPEMSIFRSEPLSHLLIGNVASEEWKKMAGRAERLHEKRSGMVQVFKRPSSALNRAQASKHQKTVI